MQASSAMVKTLQQAGFTLARRSGPHYVWRCPCGHRQITSPKTPGKGRTTQNTKAEIARTLKACGQQMKECA